MMVRFKNGFQILTQHGRITIGTLIYLLAHNTHGRIRVIKLKKIFSLYKGTSSSSSTCQSRRTCQTTATTTTAAATTAAEQIYEQ
jgi:hypothetical protein